MLLDTHVHVWASGVIHPFQRSRAPLGATVDDLRRTLSDAGVSGAIVVPSSADLDNGRALEASAKLGESSAAIALLGRALDPDVERELATAGYRGLRLNLKDPAAAADLADGKFSLALRRAGSDRLPLAVQLGPGRVAALDRLARQHDDLMIVIDHYGSPVTPVWGPDQDSLVELLAYPNVFLKMSAMESWSGEGFPFADCWPLARRLCEASDVHRLVWASNWPLSTEVCTYAELLTVPERILGLTKAEADLVQGENARALYRL